MKLYFCETAGGDPYENLALEQYLTRTAAPDSCLLFLWQNAGAVVIGRNQNSRAECNLDAMRADGVLLARRLSGGGAVYHDLGNLNFSFIAQRGVYDENRQLDVVARAVNSLGLSREAKRSGRNDLEIDGAKFSGNAFLRAENCCHHGTILIRTDFDKLAKYLNVSSAKLAAKGVPSVRSRVVNLSSLGDVTVSSMKESFRAAFEKEYGLAAKPLDPRSFDQTELTRLRDFFSADTWLQSRIRLARFRGAERFEWGSVEICFDVDQGMIHELQVFTDALDEELAAAIADAYNGRPLSDVELADDRRELADVGGMIARICSEQVVK
ncbi:MAG: lipoate--protein ligase [Synergistaceae bacterium]|nr:lipoate--protein ligase [Synergistaceae bacterium]